MECIAWATHKYIMHGILWTWHASHHEPYKGFFEKNDLFAVVFSIPAMLAIMGGLYFSIPWLVCIGAGFTLYGICYILFHDIIVHRRIKIDFKPGWGYMKRLVRAHKIHHKTNTREGGKAFGFFYALPKYNVKELDKEPQIH